MSESIGHCRDCRWWEKGKGVYFLSSRGKCLSIVEGMDPQDDHKGAFIEVLDPAYVYLLTKPDFGCVQFERKE